MSKVVSGVLFQSINFKDNKATFSGADNRPYFATTGNAAKIDPNFTNVSVMGNTSEGYNYNATFTLAKRVPNCLDASLGYSYGVSRDVVNGVRVSPAANYEWNQSLVANDPALAYFNFDLRHKFIGNLAYTMPVKDKFSLSANLIYIARSGSPFSFVYEGDVNRDGSAKNNLLFVPADASQIQLADITGPNNVVLVSAQQQYAQLDQYIANDEYIDPPRHLRRAQRRPHPLDATARPASHRQDTPHQNGLAAPRGLLRLHQPRQPAQPRMGPALLRAQPQQLGLRPARFRKNRRGEESTSVPVPQPHQHPLADGPD